MPDLAIVALTPNGLALGQRIAAALGRGEVIDVRGSIRETLGALFQAGRPLVCVMALGIVVRVLGPLTRDKASEPAVVVVDEAGRFAVSVLGGHEGGANELAAEVAKGIGATAVITTASESRRMPAVDLIGRVRGWKIENRDSLTTVAAAVVRGGRIAVYQEAGDKGWWRRFGDWPPTFEQVSELPDKRWDAALIICDRVKPPPEIPHLIYRPPSLVFGIGCKRGVPCEAIEAMFQKVCRDHGLSPLSLGMVSSADLKADERGLIEFAELHQVPTRFFALDELAILGEPPTPSERVRAKIGIAGVAEPSAILASGRPKLLVTKQIGLGITMAVARAGDA